MDKITVPVSIGEAIDKLSILDIKRKKISDERKFDVEKEYEMLLVTVKPFLHEFNEFYNSMMKVNLIIWDQMNKLRDMNEMDNEYSTLCKMCITTNDIRFRIKNKINLISNSCLKEQKSYHPNRICIELNCSEKCVDLFIQPIRYLSYQYDEIIIKSTSNIDTIKKCFVHDLTIKYDTNSNHFTSHFIFNEDIYTKHEIYQKLHITENDVQLFS